MTVDELQLYVTSFASIFDREVKRHVREIFGDVEYCKPWDGYIKVMQVPNQPTIVVVFIDVTYRQHGTQEWLHATTNFAVDICEAAIADNLAVMLKQRLEHAIAHFRAIKIGEPDDIKLPPIEEESASVTVQK